MSATHTVADIDGAIDVIADMHYRTRTVMADGMWTPDRQSDLDALDRVWDRLRIVRRTMVKVAGLPDVGDPPARPRVSWTKTTSDDCGVCHLPLVPDAVFMLGMGDLRATTVGHEPPKAYCYVNGLTEGVTRPEHWACNRWKATRPDSELPTVPASIIGVVTSDEPVYLWPERSL